MMDNADVERFVIDNLIRVKSRIRNACERVGRKPADVKLLLATKTVDASVISLALKNGDLLIGENKAQELKHKAEELKEHAANIHFIGHLQTNKIKTIAAWVSCIHSVDRLELAQKLHSHLQSLGKSMDIFLQVNTSGEVSKFGVSPEKALQLATLVSRYDTLKVKGLMTIGLFSAEAEKVRECFKLLKSIKLKIAELGLPNTEMNELSMGMSNDLEIAIEEGSTIVRVGTAVFGSRRLPDSYYWNEAP